MGASLLPGACYFLHRSQGVTVRREGELSKISDRTTYPNLDDCRCPSVNRSFNLRSSPRHCTISYKEKLQTQCVLPVLYYVSDSLPSPFPPKFEVMGALSGSSYSRTTSQRDQDHRSGLVGPPFPCARRRPRCLSLGSRQS